MPTVDYLVLADAAATAGGKHYIHGAGWDIVYGTSFPITHPMLSVAVRLRVAWNETNQPIQLEVDVVDSDEQSVLPEPPGPLRGQITVGRPPQIPVGNDQVVPLVFNLAGLHFATAGTYVVVVRVDGVDSARSPFQVMDLLPGQMS